MAEFQKITAPTGDNRLCAAELRLIEAFGYMQERHMVTLYGFAKDTGTNIGTFHAFRKGSNRKARIEWFVYLCERGVSPEWLLLGTGPIMRNK
jgi:hypothetical protein